jgi:hypothetical protein
VLTPERNAHIIDSWAEGISPKQTEVNDMYYALSDSFTGSDPKEHTGGFANTKMVIAFESRANRDSWVEETKLLTASPLTRSEAVKASRVNDNGDRVAEIYGSEDEDGIPQYHVIKKSNRW